MSIQKRASWRDLILVRTILWRLGRQVKPLNQTFTFLPPSCSFQRCLPLNLWSRKHPSSFKKAFWYPPVNKHSNGKSPSWIGNTSSNGGFPIAMLVYWRVSFCRIFRPKYGPPSGDIAFVAFGVGEPLAVWRHLLLMGFSVWKGFFSWKNVNTYVDGQSLSPIVVEVENHWLNEGKLILEGPFHVPVKRIHRFKLHNFRWS